MRAPGGSAQAPDRARRRSGSIRRKRMAKWESGGGAGTRTPDTEIMILLLYQLSYAAKKEAVPRERRARKDRVGAAASQGWRPRRAASARGGLGVRIDRVLAG